MTTYTVQQSDLPTGGAYVALMQVSITLKFNSARTLTTKYSDFRCNTVSNDASEWFNFVECVQN